MHYNWKRFTDNNKYALVNKLNRFENNFDIH